MPTDIPSKIESRVLAEQLALVLANTRGTLFMAAVLAPIVWYLLRPTATPFAMDGWFAALSLSYFLRFLVLRAYQRCDRPEGHLRTWVVVYVSSTFLSGTIWGLVGTVLFPHSSAALQGAAILVIAGLPVGALYALSPLFWAFAAFSLPILVPATLYHLLADVTEPRIVGFGLGLLTATFIATALKLQRVNTDSLRLRIEREDIAEERERARRAAETANHAKSQFLATMSHEIRTPMNGILGMTELLRGTALNAQQSRFTDAVYQSGEHLLSIINDILDFSKIEAGKLEIESINFNLRQLVEDVGYLFAHAAEAKGLEMVCAVPHDVPVAVRGDPVRVRQVMTNLVGNAVKFTRRGEVVVRVRLLHENSHQARFRFEVQDTGIGIDEPAQSRVFNAFAQADSSTTRRYGGTGLGLAIAKRLVEMMHGLIGLDSEVGHGSVFWFEIPFIKQDADARTVIDMAERLTGLRVLVVDDNATNREILEHQLQGWSMRYTGAAGGTAALRELEHAAARSEPFDLAILDLHMPGMDGFELAQAIKSDPHLTAMPLVMLSSVSVGSDHPQWRTAPIDYYLTKPVRQSDLYDALATATSFRKVAAPVAPPPLPAPPASLGARVLVAEDNPVNQQVAAAMLESLGVAYSLAGNGLVALELVLHEQFDLVLMDCQMPEMDGFAATAQIRARQGEGRLRRNLPVVALTANAVEGDREHCLAAGMDDYLSKPFSRDQLAAMLMRWLPQSRPVQAAAAANPPLASSIGTEPAAGRAQSVAGEPAAPGADEPINPRALDAIRHLPGPNGAALVGRVIRAYLADTPARLAQMRAALDAGDAQALRKTAHGLKSSSANVGAETLAALCKELETIGRSGSLQAAPTLLKDAEAQLVRVVAALEAQIEGRPEHALA